MTWTGILEGGPLDGSQGTVQWPARPPDEMWPIRCPGPARCPLPALVPDAAAECDRGAVHWLARRHPALAGRQHPYERVGVDRRNRHRYRYPEAPDELLGAIAPGAAILADPATATAASRAWSEARPW